MACLVCLLDLQLQARYDCLEQEHQLLEQRHNDYVFCTAEVSDSLEDIESLQYKLAEMEEELTAVKADHDQYRERNRHLVVENSHLLWVSFITSHSFEPCLEGTILDQCISCICAAFQARLCTHSMQLKMCLLGNHE